MAATAAIVRGWLFSIFAVAAVVMWAIVEILRSLSLVRAARVQRELSPEEAASRRRGARLRDRARLHRAAHARALLPVSRLQRRRQLAGAHTTRVWGERRSDRKSRLGLVKSSGDARTR
eukprot:349998-Pleurochrysis_carterae.AAC.1